MPLHGSAERDYNSEARPTLWRVSPLRSRFATSAAGTDIAYAQKLHWPAGGSV